MTDPKFNIRFDRYFVGADLIWELIRRTNGNWKTHSYFQKTEFGWIIAGIISNKQTLFRSIVSNGTVNSTKLLKFNYEFFLNQRILAVLQ